MKINLQNLQNNYKQEKTVEGMDPEKVNAYCSRLYGNSNPAYANVPPYEMKEIQNQVENLCNLMEEQGLKNFSGLKEKFDKTPENPEEAKMLNSIKETMEAIAYQTKHGTLSSEAISNQFGDRSFLCKDGTLTNLQSILGEMSLGKQDLKVYIVEQKNNVITQMIEEMYRKGEFREYPWVLRQYKPMEIHNITSLKNAVAEEYGLLTKTKAEDKYLKNISNSSKQKMLSQLSEKINDPQVIDSFVEGIAMNVVANLPYFEKGMDPLTYSGNLTEALSTLGINKELAYNCLTVYEDSRIQAMKPHFNEIVKDAVSLKLHNEGLIENPDIEKVKLRLELEASVNIMMDANAVSSEVVESAKEKGLEEYAYKYMIDKGLKFDADEFDTTDPVKYCIDNKIKIDNKDPRDYALDNIIEQYLKENDPKIKTILEEKYKETHNYGKDQEVQLLGMDSKIGQFVSSPDAAKSIAEFNQIAGKNTNSFNKIDYKNCDLKLIEQCNNALEKSTLEKGKDYTKFSKLQKVVNAVTKVFGVIGSAVTELAFRKSNQKKLTDMEIRAASTLEKLGDELEKISKVDIKSNIKKIALNIKSQNSSNKSQKKSVAPTNSFLKKATSIKLF